MNATTIRMSLTDMIWASEPRTVLECVRAYCPFFSSGAMAAEITEKAIAINTAYNNNVSAKEIDLLMLELKQKATGVNLEDARMMGFVPNYTETLNELPYHRGTFNVDLLVNEAKTYE